jgi:hypothetical protein
MHTDKIYCFGDGYATGHIWPEWPQILQALLPNHQVIITAGIGAGAEWLVTRMIQQLSDIPGNTVVWQWPQANRFDKLIEDDVWHSRATSDPVYHFNLHNNQNQTWWLSSASPAPEVRKYHRDYVQPQQHQQRLINYQTLVQHTLENLNCPHMFFSTQDQEIYSQQSRFSTTRQKEIQPSPIVHFNYCVEHILPRFNLTSPCKNQLESLIVNQKWVPYDPDRQQIWQEIKDQLKTLTDK